MTVGSITYSPDYKAEPRPFKLDPTKCSHSFAWWSVVPPTECPLCGSPLDFPPSPSVTL